MYLYLGRFVAGTGYGFGSTLTGEASTLPRIAAAGDLSAAVYQVQGTTTIHWVRATASMVAGAPVQLTDGGQRPDIAATSSGAAYALAWATRDGFDFQINSATDGTKLCGPMHTFLGNGIVDAGDAVAVSATQYGIVVLVVDSGGQIQLFRFSDSCAVVDGGVIRSGAGLYQDPSIAVGGGYLAIGWWESGSVNTGYVRVMGERLCN